MTYLAIDDATAEIADTEAALLTAVQDRARQNAEHTAANRLKKHGVVFPLGVSANPTIGQVEFDDFAGPTGQVSLSNIGASVTGTDIRSAGAVFVTPTQRPLCMVFPWPISANASAIRAVICSAPFGAYEVLMHVWDGVAWYPTPPGMHTVERWETDGFESPDTLRFADRWRSLPCFAVIGPTRVSPADECRWDALTVFLQERSKIDRSCQLAEDANNIGRIAFSFISQPVGTLASSLTTTITAVEDIRAPTLDAQSFQMPILCRDGAGVGWLAVTGTDGVVRWHLLASVDPGNGSLGVTAYVWPPLQLPEEGVGVTADVIVGGVVQISSIGITEIGDA